MQRSGSSQSKRSGEDLARGAGGGKRQKRSVSALHSELNALAPPLPLHQPTAAPARHVTLGAAAPGPAAAAAAALEEEPYIRYCPPVPAAKGQSAAGPAEAAAEVPSADAAAAEAPAMADGSAALAAVKREPTAPVCQPAAGLQPAAAGQPAGGAPAHHAASLPGNLAWLAGIPSHAPRTGAAGSFSTQQAAALALAGPSMPGPSAAALPPLAIAPLSLPIAPLDIPSSPTAAAGVLPAQQQPRQQQEQQQQPHKGDAATQQPLVFSVGAHAVAGVLHGNTSPTEQLLAVPAAPPAELRQLRDPSLQPISGVIGHRPRRGQAQVGTRWSAATPAQPQVSWARPAASVCSSPQPMCPVAAARRCRWREQPPQAQRAPAGQAVRRRL